VPNRTPGSLMLSTQELQLDAAGAARGVFTQLPKSGSPQDIQAELEYQDPNGETLTASTTSRCGPRR